MLAPDARFAVQASLDLYSRILDVIGTSLYGHLPLTINRRHSPYKFHTFILFHPFTPRLFLERNGYDNFNKRAYTTKLEKLSILPGSWKIANSYGT